MTRKIILTAQQLKSVPGHGTHKTVDQLRGMVAGLLTEAGLDYGLMKRDGADMVLIEMVLDTDDASIKRVIHFKLEVPQVYQQMKKGDPKPLPEVGWRFFFDYLDRRIQAVKLGITDLVEEFTANIVMPLPDGRQSTLGDSIKQSIADPGQAMLPFIQTREATTP
ncbi:MAG: hypothetical protein ABIJ47_06965 [Candidatus Bathyarchaeota archaeon]